MSDPVRYRVEDGIGVVTLDNPPVNIMTAAVMHRIAEAAAAARKDDTLCGLLLRAEGKAFSAGADVAEHAPEKAGEMIGAFSRMFTELFALEIPVVAAVQGAALGGGFELVMAADIVVASRRAKFGQPEIKLGFFAPLGVAYLPTLVGYRRAMALTCTGRTYDAETLERWGFVNEVADPEGLDDAVARWLGDLRAASPLVQRLNVRTLKASLGRPVEEGRRAAERVFLEELMRTEDVREGIASFEEKRRPVWKNR